MIVRNEEELLPRCLQSVQGIVDELIIVDTGSQDQTVAIAQAFGAKVFDYAWNDNFASARNFSLRKATCDWILYLDADEMATESFRTHIRRFLQESDAIVCQCVLEDHYAQEVALEPIIRLFRNIPGVHFVRAYHEMLNFKEIDYDKEVKAAYHPELRLFHDGYLPMHIQSKDKVARSLQIMGSYIEDNPQDYYIQSKLAGALCDVGEQERALELSAQALDNLSRNPTAYDVEAYEVQLIYASIRARLHYWEEARTVAQKAVASSLPDIHKTSALLLLAQIHENQGSYEQALEVCQRVLPYLPNHYGLNMVWGRSLQSLKDYVGAQAAYEGAIRSNSEDVVALRCLAATLMETARPSQALVFLERAVQLAPKDPYSFYELGRAYSLAHRLQEAQEQFEIALSLCIDEEHRELLKQSQDSLGWIAEHLQDNWPNFYDQGQSFPPSSGCFDRIVAFLIGRELSVLELGCGTGNLAGAMSGLVERYTGIDISTEALQYLQFCGLDTLETNIEEPLPLENETYGCVVATHLLEYTSDAELVIQEAFRVLQVDGWLILATNLGKPLPGMPRPQRIYTKEHFTALIQTVAKPENFWLQCFDEQFLNDQEEIIVRPILLAIVKKEYKAR